MGSSFPYGICRLCGSDPPINSVDALLMPSFIDLTQCLLGIKIRDTDKCSKLVCKSCVNIVKNFSVFASRVKATQLIIEQFNSFNEQENEAAKSDLKFRDENVFLISDESSSEDEPLAQLLRSSTVAEPMVVIPCLVADKKSDMLEAPSEFERKRLKRISTNFSQDYTIQKIKCVSCSVFLKTSFEEVYHSHFHKKGTCLYCMEEIVSGTDMTNHFMDCFLSQCHIVDVLSCYIKKCSVRVDAEIENSANLTQTKGQPEAQVPLSANIDVISKRPKQDTLLISKKHAEHLGKLQNTTLKINTQYIPVKLVRSTDTQECDVACAEISRSSVRYELIKEKIAQQYGNFKLLWNVQKVVTLKPRKQGISLIVPPIAASAKSNNDDDIVNSEAAPRAARSLEELQRNDNYNNLLLEDNHNRKPNEISPTKQSRGIVTQTNNTLLPTSSIDLLTDSSDDETFPSFFKAKNSVVKQYKGISNSNELRSLSTRMQVTQNIDNPIYCSNAPSTSQLTFGNPFSITPSDLPVVENANSPQGTATVIVNIPAPVPQLSAITNLRYDPNSPSITHFHKSPTRAGAPNTDNQPKPSTTSKLYNSMLLNLVPTILNTNSDLPGLSGQSWQQQQMTTARPKNTPLKVVAPSLELAHHEVVMIDMPNGQNGLDRLHILSPQDINNRIS